MIIAWLRGPVVRCRAGTSGSAICLVLSPESLRSMQVLSSADSFICLPDSRCESTGLLQEPHMPRRYVARPPELSGIEETARVK